MRSTRWMVTLAVGVLMMTSHVALAQEHEHGEGRGKGHENHGDEGDNQDHRDHRDHQDHRDHYDAQDRESVRGWYDEHENNNNLPRGLAKRDRLPPGLERQLVLRGALPLGLQRRIQPCPEDLERRLPPPPSGYAHVLLGGHIVLLNPRSYVVVDIIHFEIR
jgi:Ni/Co efflux regulator RcnB